ncbi:hypothetical protein RLEG12_08345 (plasmid) [Rhizobium leguminosarum bv. trifolii CB782]|nr:hypothetical protein RLEG12_08345 [Rhizobium leguminosarum bv. trifolii CB782]
MCALGLELVIPQTIVPAIFALLQPRDGDDTKSRIYRIA